MGYGVPVRRVVVAVLVAALALVGLTATARAAVTPSITVSAPATGTKGTTFALTGQLTADAPGGVRLSVQGVRRVEGPWPKTTALSTTTTTAADGSFSVNVMPATAGYFTYTVSVTGQAYTASASADVTVSGPEAYVSATATPGYLGHPFTVTGTVYAFVGPAIGGATVVETRSFAGASTTQNLTTAADGTFTFTDSSSVIGTIGYRFTSGGDAGHPQPLPANIVVPVSYVPVTITTSVTPTAPKPLDTVTIAGKVTFAAGEQVTSPLTLTVTKGLQGYSTTTPLPSVVTAADGSFSLDDVAHAGTWVYVLRYAGDPTHTTALQQVPVNVAYLASTVSVQVAPGQTLAWGHQFLVTGKVTVQAPGTPLVSGLTVTPHGSCGPNWGAFPVILAADGTFTARVLPACVSDTVVDATYVDAEHARSTASTPSLAVGKAPAVVHIGFYGSANGTTADWLTPVGVQASVDFAVGKGRLDVYAQPYGGRLTLVHQAWITDGYDPGFIYYPDRRTVFTAVYNGDSGNLSGSTRTTLNVRPSMREDLGLWSRQSRGSFYYRHTVKPELNVWVSPTHVGKPVQILVDRYVGGRWRRVAVRTVTIPRAGYVTVRLANGPAGSIFRVSSIWPGDPDHAATYTRWSFYRFT